MSSEEMRIELEMFVNIGLREGWCGWPLKDGVRTGRGSSLPLHANMVRLWRKTGSGLAAFGERLGARGIVSRLYVEN
ncbi:MAG: hypothetical protein JW955_13405 [Sedimentisphaerales bacterium]|nr:hypothetical protein [Sedimentisphaerales bacterium]